MNNCLPRNSPTRFPKNNTRASCHFLLGTARYSHEKPWKVIKHCDALPIEPEASCEREGLVPSVIFHNGQVDLYYGTADTVTCGARVDKALDDVRPMRVDNVLRC